MAASATSVHGERECNGERLRRPRVAVHEHGPARTRRLRTVQAPVRTRGELPPTARSARDSPPPRGHPQQTPPASSCPWAARMRASIASPQTTCSLSPRRARIGSASRTASWAARRRSSIASSVFPWPTSALEIAREVQGPAACANGTGPVRAGRPRRTAGGELRIAQSPRRASSARGTLRARRRCAEQARFPHAPAPRRTRHGSSEAQ